MYIDTGMEYFRVVIRRCNKRPGELVGVNAMELRNRADFYLFRDWSSLDAPRHARRWLPKVPGE